MAITSVPVRRSERVHDVAEPTASDLRHSARCLAGTVAVVSVATEEKVLAKTVSSFTTVSLTPALVSVWVGSASPVSRAIAAAQVFTVSVLDAAQQHVAAALSAPGSGPRGTAAIGVPMAPSPSGAVVVRGCLSWFDCQVDGLVESGDHTLLIGAVRAAGRRAGEPLVYHDGQYRSLSRAAAKNEHYEECSQ